MGVDHNVTLNTGLRGVGPAVATHPLPLTLWTLVLPKTSLLALVGCQPLPLGSGLLKSILYSLLRLEDIKFFLVEFK